jgi:aarF domain-containing kinase
VQQQHHHQKQPWWYAGKAGSKAETAAAADAAVEMPQWERELQQLSAHNQQRWAVKHGAPPAPHGASAQQQAADSSSSSNSESAQLVLLDFGLAEQLTATVRHHFISFLNAISAGDGLAAAHHLLRWSTHQTCPDRRAFGSDMVDLFHAACDIHSPQGIDLDYVMQQVLGLARKHSVAIDSCYASLVISVCVLVGFGKALDPEVNLMDAATPTLLAYALTGKVVGRLYS